MQPTNALPPGSRRARNVMLALKAAMLFGTVGFMVALASAGEGDAQLQLRRLRGTTHTPNGRRVERPRFEPGGFRGGELQIGLHAGRRIQPARMHRGPDHRSSGGETMYHGDPLKLQYK